MEGEKDKNEAIEKNIHISQWESQLKEIFNYIAENFDVILNDGHYRFCNNPYKLIFQDCPASVKFDSMLKNQNVVLLSNILLKKLLIFCTRYLEDGDFIGILKPRHAKRTFGE
ncbi:hypothetical protein Lal_00040135 [Lupinus albus]|nr:hypothetical protein Lal_00040135 [Lupinus albus]